jgi:hypothetical protein
MKSLLYFALTGLLVLSADYRPVDATASAESTPTPQPVAYTHAEPASIEGAWTMTATDADGNETTYTTIVMDGYLAETAYNVADQRFVRTWGGRYEMLRDSFLAIVEFDSADPERVGKSRSLAFKLDGDKLYFPDDDETWTRVDSGTESPLAGAWLITGRERDGEMTRRTPGERKTMKILSGTRFQWIAYHVGTGAFSGTGGGTYTAKDGKYVENIEFFSRDGSRVGASLSFDFAIKDGEWHHSGLSSRGAPIYEIWTLRETLE